MVARWFWFSTLHSQKDMVVTQTGDTEKVMELPQIIHQIFFQEILPAWRRKRTQHMRLKSLDSSELVETEPFKHGMRHPVVIEPAPENTDTIVPFLRLILWLNMIQTWSELYTYIWTCRKWTDLEKHQEKSSKLWKWKTLTQIQKEPYEKLANHYESKGWGYYKHSNFPIFPR